MSFFIYNGVCTEMVFYTKNMACLQTMTTRFFRLKAVQLVIVIIKQAENTSPGATKPNWSCNSQSLVTSGGVREVTSDVARVGMVTNGVAGVIELVENI